MATQVSEEGRGGILELASSAASVGESMIEVQSAAITDTGRRRMANEDALLCDDQKKLYLVADGLGGHRAGAVASTLAVKTIQECMEEYENIQCTEDLETFDSDLSLSANKLLSSIHRANREVNKLSREVEDYRGMGSTVSAVYFTGDGLVAANVGDSPIWLVHDQTIETLSVEHTVVKEQAGMSYGGWGLNEGEYRHVLSRALGIGAAVDVDVTELHCFEGDIVVIGSDGLSNKVSSEEILGTVSRESPDMACRLLIELANDRGGEDNISAVVVKIGVPRRKNSSLIDWVRRLLK